jgi:hypothetical protein
MMTKNNVFDTGFRFEMDNTWKQYRELAILPSIFIYLETHPPGFYCIKVNFLAWEMAICWK